MRLQRGSIGSENRPGEHSSWCGWSSPERWIISCGPVLIRKGADLPLLLVFAGVVGGLVAFGFIGIFVGPVILAAADKLLMAWIEGDGQPSPNGDIQANQAAVPCRGALDLSNEARKQ